MNRMPWWLRFTQAFITVLTFPLSVPFLMIRSWVNRGTLNFIKTDGSVYLDKIIHLCRKSGVNGPSKTELPAAPATTNSNLNPNAPNMNQGVNMPSPRESYQQMQIVEASITTERNNTAAQPIDMPLPTTLPNLEEDVNGMANIAGAFTQVLIDNPTVFVQAEVQNSNGKAVFMKSPRIQRIEPYVLLQKFDYASAWTKPWQELDEFSSQIKVFRQFTFTRRRQQTDKVAADISPPKGKFAKFYTAGLALLHSDSKTLLEKAKQNSGSGPTAHKLYREALSVAKNNSEYTEVMEALINYHSKGLKELDEFADRYNPEFFYELKQKGTNQLEQYIDQLPQDYQLHTSTAETLDVYFEKIWQHLEMHELDKAWSVFCQDDLEKSEMKNLIHTPFVQLCLPHLVSMWHQIMGLFLVNGGSGIGISATNEASLALFHMSKALRIMQKHNLPEATIFEQKCVVPLKRMQAHAEELFQQVLLETARFNAVQHFRDAAVWEIEERLPCYRHEGRGAYHPRFSLFAGHSERIIEKIDAMQPTSAPSRLSV